MLTIFEPILEGKGEMDSFCQLNWKQVCRKRHQEQK